MLTFSMQDYSHSELTAFAVNGVNKVLFAVASFGENTHRPK